MTRPVGMHRRQRAGSAACHYGRDNMPIPLCGLGQSESPPCIRTAETLLRRSQITEAGFLVVAELPLRRFDASTLRRSQRRRVADARGHGAPVTRPRRGWPRTVSSPRQSAVFGTPILDRGRSAERCNGPAVGAHSGVVAGRPGHRPARSSTLRACRATASSIKNPASSTATPDSAASRPASTARALHTSSEDGVNTRRTGASCAG